MKKGPTNTTRLWRLLSSGRWVSMRAMLAAAGFRYGARLYDLRRKFGCIVHVRKRGGAYEYKMEVK